MRIFIIHRFLDKVQLENYISKVRPSLPSDMKFILLNSYKGSSWKKKALKNIELSEVVLVFNRQFCLESENAKWEIDEVSSRDIPVIDFNRETDSKEFVSKLKGCYDYESEFLCNFSENNSNKFELYKIMVASSEALVERRQKTNAFFITIVGSLIAIGGLLNKFEVLTTDNAILVSFYSIIAILICNSWRNLLDNYGKLNTAKFKVIGRLEKDLGDQIFNAEWIALGKGNRKDKYKSFTETEKNVPVFVGALFFMLSIVSLIIKIFA